MKNRKESIEIKHKKPYETNKENNPVVMNGDSNMRKPVRGLNK